MAFVISHPEHGIYLGNCMGLGFWSKIDPVGQPSAVTFPTQSEAEEHMSKWDDGRPLDVTLHEVTPDNGDYASISACVAAGLDGWIDAEPAQSAGIERMELPGMWDTSDFTGGETDCSPPRGTH